MCIWKAMTGFLKSLPGLEAMVTPWDNGDVLKGNGNISKSRVDNKVKQTSFV